MAHATTCKAWQGQRCSVQQHCQCQGHGLIRLTAQAFCQVSCIAAALRVYEALPASPAFFQWLPRAEDTLFPH